MKLTQKLELKTSCSCVHGGITKRVDGKDVNPGNLCLDRFILKFTTQVILMGLHRQLLVQGLFFFVKKDKIYAIQNMFDNFPSKICIHWLKNIYLVDYSCTVLILYTNSTQKKLKTFDKDHF